MSLNKSYDKDSSIFLIFREVAFGASHYEGICEHHFRAAGVEKPCRIPALKANWVKFKVEPCYAPLMSCGR